MPSTKPERTDLEFILDEDQWPNWPLLPVKRPNPDGGWPDTATLVASVDGKYRMKMAGIWDAPQEFLAAAQVEFPSAQAVVDAGWRVD